MNKRAPGGFTLLEILVVLTILLTGLAVLSTLLGSAMKQAVEAEEKTSIQMICQNRMNQILSGEATAVVDDPETIEGFETWTMTVHLDDAPLPQLTRIRIVAQKYEQRREPSPDRPGVYIQSSVPILGQHLILAQWARRNRVKLERPASGGVIGSLGTADAFATPDAPAGIDPFAAGGFAPSDGGVFVPGMSESGAESGPEFSPSAERETGKIGGDPISDALLERARNRRREAGL